ncbi:hypothetical protein D9757_012026 [Collybiopsis confluens]|uniref:Uncharacterized protein n=1 Tax=Collybiopsis confluens TaxID=2823264 RepID=A0A8H5GDR9_9AGAR|nr:hypothetical protein D9757_012026 [Collybiopsis confluens]
MLSSLNSVYARLMVQILFASLELQANDARSWPFSARCLKGPRPPPVMFIRRSLSHAPYSILEFVVNILFPYFSLCPSY